MKGIYDIEELILTVRDQNSKKYITESYKSYLGGAYRSSIISAWIAVTYDVISKLRELAENGDAQAAAKVLEFDNLIQEVKTDKSKLKKLQEFENEILKVAMVDFNLISEAEFKLLSRIKEDRNLCAHPFYVNTTQLFEPSAELVKSHIVHSITTLLKHRPVQGKAAFDAIIADIKKVSFPKEFTRAKSYLKSKYLDNSKVTLRSNLIKGLLKGLLKGEVEDSDKLNVTNTLATLAEEFTELNSEIVNTNLSKITSAVSDDKLWNVLIYLTKNQQYWNSLEEHNRLRIIEFIRSLDNKSMKIFEYYKLFRKIGIEEIKESLDSKLDLIYDFILESIEKFGRSGSYASALANAKEHILPYISIMDAQLIDTFVKSILNNRSDQILPAAEMENIIEGVYDADRDNLEQTGEFWTPLKEKLSEYDPKYSSLLRKMNNDL